MPEPDPARVMPFATPKDLGQWLKVNHATESELWVKMFKTKTGTPSVTWDDVVIEALCWGWIDGIKKSIDDQSCFQRITPRKARSNWSKRNREHVQRLISEGRMTESGLVHVCAARADGRWENAYAVSEMKVPAQNRTQDKRSVSYSGWFGGSRSGRTVEAMCCDLQPCTMSISTFSKPIISSAASRTAR